MKVKMESSKGEVSVDLSMPIDISMPLRADKQAASAWYVEPMKITPVVMGDWVGSVKQGGSVNFMDIAFNSHGNGTHTECVGHISKEWHYITDCLKTFWFEAKLISVQPQHLSNGDSVFTKNQLESLMGNDKVDALILRTLPNDKEKLNLQHSNTNWPYLEEEAALFLREKGIKHFLTDQPSIDREFDEGKLLAHHAFWNYPAAPRLDATITELVFVPDEVVDGIYMLNIQIASFENDASPSKPILYRVN